MPPVVLDARRFPPTIYENTDVALARQYAQEAQEAGGTGVEDVTAAKDEALTEISDAQAAAQGAISGDLALSAAYASAVVNQLRVEDLFPDPLFREIDPGSPFYPKVTGKARRRLFGTWTKVKSPQSPYDSGFSLRLAAATASASIDISVIDPGREVAVGDALNVALSMSGAGTAVFTATWMGAGGNIGSGFTFRTPNVALNGAAQTITNTAVLTVPDGATTLRVTVAHSGTAQDKFVHAVWAQRAGTAIMSEPAYRFELPADIMWRIRDLESRANGGALLRRVAYTAAAFPLPVSGGAASVQSNFYTGWGARLTPAGVSFNAISLPGLVRAVGSTNWRKLAVMIRKGATGSSHQKGTVVAVGMIDLDPNVTSYNSKLYVPLRDPETDAFITLTDASLGTEYFAGYYAIDETGQASSIGLCNGATANIVGASGYRLQSNSQNDPLATWIADANSVGIEHVLLTSPSDSYEPSATLAAQILALAASDPKTSWAVAPTTTYDTMTRALAASDSDATAVYGLGYSGFGGRFTPAGVSFNAIGISRLSRNPAIATAANAPASVNVVVRAGTSGTTWATGAIIAVGSVPVSIADFEYRDLVIPLVDPVTGLSKTLTDADLGAQYGVGFYVLTANGANAPINPAGGAMPNAVAANEHFYLPTANSALTAAWNYATPVSSQPIEHLMIANPKTGFKPSYNLASLFRGVDGNLVLPPKIYGVQGREVNIYLDSLSPTELRDIDYRFQFGASQGVFHGQQQDERWTFTPAATAINQAFTVFAYDRASGELVGSAASTLVTVLAATTARTIKSLGIGDSVTANNPSWVNELNTLQAADANLKITFQGTKSTNGVAHEGISGWTSQQWYAPTTVGDQTANKFYNSATGKFDYATYLSVTGQPAADVVEFHLGINDLGTANSDQAAISRGARCASNINAMIASIKSVSPSTVILVNLTIPPSLHQDGMVSASNNAYAGRRPARRQRRNQILLAREKMKRFAGREAEGIYVVATNLAIDTERGFPYSAASNASSRSAVQVTRVSDSIHPNAGTGILQFADAVWAALKVIYA